MTNTSIKNAFQRMWEYTLTKLPNLPSISTADTGKLLTVDQNGEWAMAENAVVDISLEATILASNWSTSTTNGYYTNQVNVIGIKAAYNPQIDLIITSAELAEDERSAMGQIIEAETFDGYVIFRALEAPTIDLNIEFSGMFANATDDLATKDYVNANGGKIDSISVNGVTQIIDENKNVNITIVNPDLSDYATKTDLNNKAPAYTYGTEDLTAGTSPLETGKLYFVYE